MGGSNKIDYGGNSSISGGSNNLIHNVQNGSISGGYCNCLCSSYCSSIVGGANNSVNASTNSNISGGHNNFITTVATVSILGGYQNLISDVGFSSIAGGVGNKICASGGHNFISGGCLNVINTANYSSIIGGTNNDINGFNNAHIIGGGYISAYASNSTFTDNMYITGNLTKGSGTFKISHPDPSKNKDCSLFHSFVESPTAGDNIYRFEVVVKDGVAEIELPDYYKYLNENTQVWITPKDGFGIAYGSINEEMTKIIVKANLDIEYNVLVIGTRKDITAKTHWKGVERIKNEAEKKNNNIKK
jgi:hypothetical protein